jgi:integrase
MANIRKIGNAYKITVSCGYDIRGKHIRRFKTWRIPENMTESQIKKAVNREAVLFEEECKRGHITSAMKFERFAEEWFESVGKIKLKERTLTNYRYLTQRVYAEIGHMQMSKITPRQIQAFISGMVNGERNDRYKKGKLSAKTIKNHVAFLSSIFEYAVRMQVVASNPCRNVMLPREKTKETKIYSVEETQKILQLLCQEPAKNLHYVLYFMLAVYTGGRRGELCALEYKNFDLERQTVTVKQATAYTPEKGVFTDSLKTKTSYRTLKMPAVVFELLARYKQQQSAYKASLGDQWHDKIESLHGKMVDNDRLFTQWNGLPWHPNTPGLFFERFCAKHGFRYISCHGWRHFNISTQIFAGVDVKTISMNAGHSTPQTTLTHYSHVFAAANAYSMEKLVEMVGVPTLPEQSEQGNSGMFTGKASPKNVGRKSGESAEIA